MGLILYFRLARGLNLFATDHELRNPEFWRRQLGYSPNPLLSGSTTDYVMLNGSRGNFCLEVANKPARDPRSIAWSTDTSHYVAFDSSDLLLSRWDRLDSERIPIHDVAANIEAFQDYLEADAPPSSTSVVRHVSEIFWQVRGLTSETHVAATAIRVFLVLLAAAATDLSRAELRCVQAQWGLCDESFQAAQLISDLDWAGLKARLQSGVGSQASTDLELTLRHASGKIFQEAHALAQISPQLAFEGVATPRARRESSDPWKTGAIYTPPALVRSVVEFALEQLQLEKRASLTIFDPAAGSGEFLREAYRQLRLSGYYGHITLVGYDISSASCDMCKFVLAHETRGDAHVTPQIDIRDSLIVDWPRNADALITNPPFLSWEDIGPERRESLRNLLADTFKYRPDTAAAFLARSARDISPTSVVAMLLPASILAASNSAALRARVFETTPPRVLASLGDRTLFPRALVDVGLFVGGGDQTASQETSPQARMMWSDHRQDSTSTLLRIARSDRGKGTVDTERFSIYVSSVDRNGSWAPRPLKSITLLRRYSAMETAGSLFEIRQGVRSGANSAFLLSDVALQELPVAEQRFFRPATVNQSIRGGRVVGTKWLFFPYGKTTIASPEELKSLVPTYYRLYLLPNRERLLQRHGVFSSNWWQLSRSRGDFEPQPKLISTYFGRAGSFAWDATGDLVVVQGFAWRASGITEAAEFGQGMGLAYLCLLNSAHFENLLAAASEHTSGGQYDLSPRFLDDIPLPNLARDPIAIDLIEEATFIGQSLYDGVTPDPKQHAQVARQIFEQAAGL